MHLRILMIGIIAISLPLGWMASRARERNAAVQAIRRNGGVVLFDYEWGSDGKPVPGARPRVPGWMVRAFGIASFNDAAFVRLERPIWNKTDLANLARFPALRTLLLKNYQIGDGDLAALDGLKRIETLDLSGSAVTDAGLVHLRGLERLRELHLGRTAVGDAGLDELARHRRLEYLDLSQTRVTDAGLPRLRTLEALQTLNLENTAVSDAGLGPLIAHRRLEMLILWGTKTTEPGIDALQEAFRTKVGSMISMPGP
jgi:hypothetical protein